MSLLCGFVVSTFAVSSITTIMTQFLLLTMQQSSQFATLRMFLTTQGVSQSLAMRIHSGARRASEENRRNTPEASVELLKLVSEPLRADLHFEVHAPTLALHPFFHYYGQLMPVAMRQVCHTAVSLLPLCSGDLIFTPGEVFDEPKFLIVLQGTLIYNEEDPREREVQSGDWACEGTLWTQWTSHGTLQATSDCNLFLLDSHRFQKTACQFFSREVNPMSYGKCFVKRLNELPLEGITDVEDRSFDYNGSAVQAFNCHDVPAHKGPNGHGSRVKDRQSKGRKSRLSAQWDNRTSRGSQISKAISFNKARMSCIAESFE